MKNFYFISLLILIFAFSCKRKEETKIDHKNVFYDKAFTFYETQKADSAFYYFNQAKNLAEEQKDSTKIIKSLLYMSIIMLDNGDFYGSIENSIIAENILKKYPDKELLTSNYNSLANAEYNLKNYQSAREYFQKALNLTEDQDYKTIIINNIANSYRKEKNPKEAIKLFNQIISSDFKNDSLTYARILSNLAMSKINEPNYNALTDLEKALKIRINYDDLWGINASYAHLTDFYLGKNNSKALDFAKKRLVISQELNSIDDELETLKQLIKLENPTASKQYFNEYQSLNDSIQHVRLQAKNQFALIRFETEKHKADYLKSEAENSKKNHQIIIISIVLILAFALLVSAFFWYKKRKKVLQQEKKIEIQQTELKLSKKVHDKVANKIYHVISEVENKDDLNKDEILNKLEVIYDISRDISYEKELIVDENYNEHLGEMLRSYSSNKTTIFVVNNEKELWQNVNKNVKTELFYVLQEFMTNMKKHSEANRVTIKFSKEKKILSVLYKDNGIGIKNFSQKNGLRNTGNRIEGIKGKITFETELEKGLQINLTIPTE